MWLISPSAFWKCTSPCPLPMPTPTHSLYVSPCFVMAPSSPGHTASWCFPRPHLVNPLLVVSTPGLSCHSLLSLVVFLQKTHTASRRKGTIHWSWRLPHRLGPECSLETHEFLRFHCFSPHPMSPGNVQVVLTGVCGSTHNGRKWGLAWSWGRGSGWAAQLHRKECPWGCPDPGPGFHPNSSVQWLVPGG